MSEATPQLLTRVQSAPIFLLSFRYRDELAALASAAGWRVTVSYTHLTLPTIYSV